MRALPVTATAFAAASLLLLSACDSGGGADGGDGDGKSTDRAAAACTIGQVRVEAGAASVAPADGDTGEVPFTVLNQGDPCVLPSTPEVVLAGVSDSETADVPLVEGAKPRDVTLAHGETTSFVVTYVRGPSFNPGHLHFRLSPGTDTRRIRWTYGRIAITDDGEHQVSVSAYQQTGD
ncbi:DUF4232 domain-containing protein [Streptomyces sp. enrichment culture]|uniref:DUF4232 domain-containing protein n=1 Tax=Streptomyces sp. enrichment culture TaxID=1795815 RepID=UPI003F55870B